MHGENRPRRRAMKSPEPAVTRSSSLHAALRHSQSPTRPPAPGPGQCLGVSSEWTVAGCPRAWVWRWGAPGPSSDAGGYLSVPLPPSPLTGWDICPQHLHRAQPRNSDIWGQVCPHGCEHEQMGEGVLGMKGSPAFDNSQITHQTPGKFEITIIWWSDLLKQ